MTTLALGATSFSGEKRWGSQCLTRWIWLLLLFCGAVCSQLEGRQVLWQNIQEAEVGDYVVALQGKNYTLLFIQERKGNLLAVEEVHLPDHRRPRHACSWQQWLNEGAPGNVCWVRYRIDLETGRLIDYYSFTKGGWLVPEQSDCLVTTLLTLQFMPVPLEERRRVGLAPMDLPAHRDKRPFWQPPLIVEGETVAGVVFEAWRSRWPLDGSPLAGRVVEIYLPQEKSARYPSYFPYWLQLRGRVGKAQAHLVNSGKKMSSPRPSLMARVAF